ncbi:hypothetical protein [Clostridium sp.]|nr:hypothetical protein [uncultured Clostridium sp.]
MKTGVIEINPDEHIEYSDVMDKYQLFKEKEFHKKHVVTYDI